MTIPYTTVHRIADACHKARRRRSQRAQLRSMQAALLWQRDYTRAVQQERNAALGRVRELEKAIDAARNTISHLNGTVNRLRKEMPAT